MNPVVPPAVAAGQQRVAILDHFVEGLPVVPRTLRQKVARVPLLIYLAKLRCELEQVLFVHAGHMRHLDECQRSLGPPQRRPANLPAGGPQRWP